MKTYQKSADAIAALNPEQYRVTQESGTERPGTGEHLHNHEPGIYVDVVSGGPVRPQSDGYSGLRVVLAMEAAIASMDNDSALTPVAPEDAGAQRREPDWGRRLSPQYLASPSPAG